jgi:LCP family protein required for cell wall assembly
VVVVDAAAPPHDVRNMAAAASAARPRSGRLGMAADGTHGRRVHEHPRDRERSPLACRDVWARITAWSVRTRVLVVLAVVLAVALGWLGVSGVRAWMAWRGLDHFPFDLDAARTALGMEGSDAPADDGYRTYLVLGLDERPAGDPTAQEEVFADAILLWVDRPAMDPVLVSIPRDLYLTSPCDGAGSKLDAMFSGCGDAATGPELVALAVEQLSGIAVDHVALVRFDGLVSAIDALGGITLCVPHDLRNGPNEILPAGCSVADGTHALRYARARTTQALVDGEWVFEDGGDALRTKRQQDVLLSMLASAKRVRTPGAVADVLSAIGDAVGVDDRLSLGEAIGLAWHLRSLPIAGIHRVAVPTRSIVTDDGLFAVVPTGSFDELLAGV